MALENPIDMEAFEHAVYDWFSESIDTQVIWTHQSAPRPPYPYGTLNIITGPTKYSQMWNREEDFDVTRDAGEEIRAQIGVPCYFDVSCQVFVKASEGRYPQVNALNTITRACARLGLESVLGVLKTAGVSVIRVEGPSNPGQLINDAFVSRAVATVVFGTILSLEEYLGYFATADLKSTTLGIDEKIEL